MSRSSPRETPEVQSSGQESVRSAPAAIHTLFTGSSSGLQTVEDWLAGVVKAVGARHAALAVILEGEAVVQYFVPKKTKLLATLSWPWQTSLKAEHEFRAAFPAMATRSPDRESSFLMAGVQHDGILWVVSLEDTKQRSWTPEEHAALTMAALGLLQFASVKEKSHWAEWSKKAALEQQLEQAGLLVGRLVHDFNNVLTSIVGFTELSLAQLPAGSVQRNFMSEVYAGAQQGTALLSRLGQFSVRKTVPKDLRTALNPLLTETANRLRTAWGAAIALEELAPADLPAVAIDADSVRVLLDKLLENAREAIATSGKVSLSARPVELAREDCLGLLGRASPGPYVEITVADSGRGFSAEARRRVFAEPFFSTKPRHRGLGFAIVYALMSNYGGGVRLEHDSPSGTVARVYLPEARHHAERSSPARTNSPVACVSS